MDKLKEFYEAHYSDDAEKKELPVFKYTKNPVNRSQACIKYFVDNKIGGEILELGAGNGTLVNSLLISNPEIKRYVATDLSAPRLQSIKNNVKSEKLEVKELDIENFKAEETGQFDAVIMLALIEHLLDPISAMKEVKKLLKTKGFVFIETPNVADIGHRLKLLRGRFPSTASNNEGLISYKGKPVKFFDNGHLHYFTFRSLTNMLKNYCGYGEVKKVPAPTGTLFFGKKIHNILAKIKPEMFSSVFVVAKP